MSKKALKRAVHIIGSQAEVARICGGNVRQGHVWRWLNQYKDENVPPAEFVLKIEAATKVVSGTDYVSRHDLRPDVFGS